MMFNGKTVKKKTTILYRYNFGYSQALTVFFSVVWVKGSMCLAKMDDTYYDAKIIKLIKTPTGCKEVMVEFDKTTKSSPKIVPIKSLRKRKVVKYGVSTRGKMLNVCTFVPQKQKIENTNSNAELLTMKPYGK